MGMRFGSAAALAALMLAVLAGCGTGHPASSGARTPTASAVPSTPTASAVPPAPTGSAVLVPPSPPANSGTGIVGVAVAVGACPAERPQPVCPELPATATVTVRRADTSTAVATVATAGDGTFRVAVPPGRYLVGATSTAMARRTATSVAVEVPAGRYVSVKLRFEIRIP